MIERKDEQEIEYEAPVVEDLEVSEGPSVTAAGGPTDIGIPAR